MAPIFRILGPLEVDGAGPLGGARPRAVLRTLLLSANQVVSTDRLIDAVWGEARPGTARHALQVYLSQLRKAIPDGAERIRTEALGYRIVVSEEELDALAFERGVREGQSLLAAGDPGGASAVLAAALALWRGEMEAGESGQVEAARLDELRVVALEHRIAADLALGRHGEIVPELEHLVAEHPLRERLREHLMLALYRSGRQADALAVYTATRRMLVEELGLEPGRELREMEAAILRQDPSLNVAPVGRGSATGLPAPATPLVGRRQEIEDIRTLLTGEARLVTVTGPGGTGKTRVGTQVALELAPSFRDGAVFVGLGALRDPELVGTEIAAALEVEAGAREMGQALADHLSPRATLVLLDNFEQVDAAAPLLSELLGAAPELRLLVTSRRPLRLYGEHEFPLPPLRLEEEAVPLFLARARAAAARLEPSADVARVCEALDCLPLAIELAAARARSIPPAEMLERLPSRLELASEGPRDAPERHRALHATIAWSHDLLDARLQRVFESLSVFAGGWDAEAAAVVAGAQADDLDALAQHSLIRAHEDRYSLLETIREFALSRLAAGDRAAAVRAAHARYFLDLANEAQRQLREGGDQLAWLARLDREHDNLRAALARLAQADPPGELRMAGALVPFWAVRGHAAEALDRLDRALMRAGPGHTREHAHALAGASVMSWIRGDHARSATLAEQALALYRALDDNPGVVRALANLGYGALQAGDVDRARALYEECLEVARAGTSRRGVTVALNCLTELELRARDLLRARRVGEQGLALAREIADTESTAVALMNLGYVAVLERRLGEARPLLREAAELFNALGDVEVTSQALDGLGAAHADEPALAARLLGAAAALRDDAGGAHDFEPQVREGAREHARAGLGEERFTAEYEWGRSAGLEAVLTDL
jgi:predicted ATPase/DNA-binding SARP family transcriptional activator